MTVTGLALFFYGLQVTRRLVVAQTLLFTVLVVVEVVRIQLIRSRYDLSPLSNRWLVGAVASSLTLQLLVVYTPLNRFFGLVPVDLPGWTWIAAAFAGFVALGVLAERAVGRLFPGSA
jgi:Ca2+-transporting ATPase